MSLRRNPNRKCRIEEIKLAACKYEKRKMNFATQTAVVRRSRKIQGFLQ